MFFHRSNEKIWEPHRIQEPRFCTINLDKTFVNVVFFFSLRYRKRENFLNCHSSKPINVINFVYKKANGDSPDFLEKYVKNASGFYIKYF